MVLYATQDEQDVFKSKNQIPVSRLEVYATAFSTPTSGLIAKYYSNPQLSGVPVREQIDPQPYFNFRQGLPIGVPGGSTRVGQYSAQWTGYFHALHSGVYDFRATGPGGVRLYFDNVQNSDPPHIDRWPHSTIILNERFTRGNGETWDGTKFQPGFFVGAQGSTSVLAGELEIKINKASASDDWAYRWLSTVNRFKSKQTLIVRARLRVPNGDGPADEVAGRLCVTNGVSTVDPPEFFPGIIIENSRIGTGDDSLRWQIKIRTTDPTDTGYTVIYEETSSSDFQKDVEIFIDNVGNLQILLDGQERVTRTVANLNIEEYYVSLEGASDSTSTAPQLFFDNIEITTSTGSSEINTPALSGLTFDKDTWHPIRVDYAPTPLEGRIGIYYSEPVSSPNFGQEKPLTVGVLSTTPEEITPTILTRVSTIDENIVSNGVSEITFSVASTRNTGGIYTYNQTFEEWGVLKKNNLIRYSAGYQTTSPPSDTDRIPQFVGFIDDISLSREEGQDMLTVQCSSLLKRAVHQINENLPDQLSYDTLGIFNFQDRTGPDGLDRPNAYDGWLITDAVRDVFLRAGIDTSYLWAQDKDGNPLIEDVGVRLDKNPSYFRPGFENDPYLYRFDFGEKMYDMVTKMADGYGYEFRDHPSGIILRTLDNPVTVDSQKANLNDWNRQTFISESGVSLYNATAEFSDAFDTLDLALWTSSQSGVNNGSPVVGILNNELELTLDQSDNVTDHAYVYRSGVMDLTFERHISFEYFMPTPTPTFDNNLFIVLRPSGINDNSPLFGPDWAAFRAFKDDSTGGAQQHEFRIQAANMQVPQSLIGLGFSGTTPLLPDEPSSRNFGDWTIDLIEQSTEIIRETFGGGMSAPFQDVTGYIFESFGSESLTFPNDALRFTLLKGAHVINLSEEIDFSTPKIIMFKMGMTGMERDLVAKADTRQTFRMDFIAGTAPVYANIYPFLYIDLVRRFVPGGGVNLDVDRARLFKPNPGGAGSYQETADLNFRLDEQVMDHYIILHIDDAVLGSKRLKFKWFINGQLIIDINEITDESLLTSLGIRFVAKESGKTVSDDPFIVELKDFFVCSPANLVVKANVENSLEKKDVIPFAHFTASDTPIPFTFSSANTYLYTSGIHDQSITNRINNYSVDLTEGPIVSGVTLTSRSLNSGVLYDTALVSDTPFDFRFNLRQSFSTYRFDFGLPEQTLGGDESFKTYFQISEANNPALPQKMQDEYFRWEADVNQSGIRHSFTDSSLDSPRNVKIDDTFQTLSPFTWGDVSTTDSGVVGSSSEGLVVKPISSLQGERVVRAIRSRDSFSTTEGLFVEASISLDAQNTTDKLNEAFILISSDQITVPSGIGASSIDPIDNTNEGMAVIFSQFRDDNNKNARGISVIEIHDGIHLTGFRAEAEFDSVNPETSIGLNHVVQLRSRYISGSNDTELYVSVNGDIKHATLASNLAMVSGYIYIGYRTNHGPNEGDTGLTEPAGMRVENIKVVSPIVRELGALDRDATLPTNDQLTLEVASRRVRVKLDNDDTLIFGGLRDSDFTRGFAAFGVESSDLSNLSSTFFDLAMTDEGAQSILAFDPRWEKKVTLRALRGHYLETSTSGVITSFPFRGQQLKLIMGRSPDSGKIKVEVDGAVPSAEFENFDLSYEREWFFLDREDPATAENPSIINVVTGLSLGEEHICKITALTGDNEVVRFDGAEFYRVDRTVPDYILSTSQDIEQFDASVGDRDVRNDIIIIGKRHDTVFDDPKNPKFDYIISRSVDADGISNPSGINYLGEKKTIVVLEPTIVTQERADYASLTLLKRHRRASILATEEGPAVPTLEPFDTLSFIDARHGTTNNRLYTIEAKKGGPRKMLYKNAFEVSPFRPFPSFQKLLQPNIDDFDGEAIVNIRIEVLDDTGNPTSVNSFTSSNPFDPYRCDQDKGSFRIRFLWDQVLDGDTHINVYSDNLGTGSGRTNEAIRGGPQEDDLHKKGRLFNEYVNAGANRFSTWDCTDNTGFYSYTASNKGSEENNSTRDNPLLYKLTFEFVHIDVLGETRVIRTDGVSEVVNSNFPQALHVQLGERVGITNFRFLNTHSITAKRVRQADNGHTWYENIGTEVIEDNVVLKSNTEGLITYNNSFKYKFKTQNNMLTNSPESIKIFAKRKRRYWAWYWNWTTVRSDVPNEPRFFLGGDNSHDEPPGPSAQNERPNQKLQDPFDFIEGSVWWHKGKHDGAAYYHQGVAFTNDFVDVQNTIKDIKGDTGYPDSEYLGIMRPLHLPSLSNNQALFDINGEGNGLVGGNFWPQLGVRYPWTSASFNMGKLLDGGESSGQFLGGADGGPTLFTMRYKRYMAIEESLDLRIEVFDNAGPWRAATETKTIFLRNTPAETGWVSCYDSNGTTRYVTGGKPWYSKYDPVHLGVRPNGRVFDREGSIRSFGEDGTNAAVHIVFPDRDNPSSLKSFHVFDSFQTDAETRATRQDSSWNP